MISISIEVSDEFMKSAFVEDGLLIHEDDRWLRFGIDEKSLTADEREKLWNNCIITYDDGPVFVFNHGYLHEYPDTPDGALQCILNFERASI